MPLLFIAVHLILSVVCLSIVLWLPYGSRRGNVFCIAVGMCVLFGFLLEWEEEWCCMLMQAITSDLPFLTNLILEGAMVLVGLLWGSTKVRSDRIRAVVLSLLLVGVAVLSYAWYFAPLPNGLTGKADASGYCRQTTEDSCSAAAVVMLLNQKGIRTDEAEMAALCLTRAGKGTSRVGIMRGLIKKSAPYGWHVRNITCTPADLHGLSGPALIAVGLSPTAPSALAAKMKEYGWRPGQYHSVVVMGGDPSGKWVDIADPSYGREKWPTEHLAALWNGKALILSR